MGGGYRGQKGRVLWEEVEKCHLEMLMSHHLLNMFPQRVLHTLNSSLAPCDVTEGGDTSAAQSGASLSPSEAVMSPAAPEVRGQRSKTGLEADS